MAGLLPDSSVGNVTGLSGDRVSSTDDNLGASPTSFSESLNDNQQDERPTATIIRIHGDKITIEDGASQPKPAPESQNFDDNIAELLDEGDLHEIAQDLLMGIEADIRSRSEFVQNYIKGLDYLGIKMQNQSATRGRRSTAKVYHPALQWACTKFQSSARAELLPASGPCKVVEWAEETAGSDEIARDLEMDMNWYLTAGAPEYYPDMDRGFYYLGYGGTLYKKIYRCPLRQRPVSDCVFIPELIVSPEASSLETALRITHDIGDMTDYDIQQLMDQGIYRQITLMPATTDENQIRRKEREISGKRETQDRPQDMPHRIFETYAFLDLSRFGHAEKGQPKAKRLGSPLSSASTYATGALPLPYKVSIDKDTRTILEIRRNWKQTDKRMRRRRTFIEYAMIPGMGTLNYGYLHLLGNLVQALTALTRLTVDAGMFANFPGGVRLKGARADTNEINPAPGEWAMLDVPVDDIRKALMAMPYKGPDATIFNLITHFEELVQQLVGAVEMSEGEGKTHIPVGTMMAMVEQQTVVMQAVHKRLHTAQAQELSALKDLFAENPSDLVEMENRSGRIWTEEMFANMSLVPASDPNVPSQVHRIMQATALATLAQSQPGLYDIVKVNKRILQAIGISDGQSYMNQAAVANGGAPPKGPDPEMVEKQLDFKEHQQEQQFQQQKVLAEGALREKELLQESQSQQADRANRLQIAKIKLAGDVMKVKATDHQHSGEGLMPQGFGGQQFSPGDS